MPHELIFPQEAGIVLKSQLSWFKKEIHLDVKEGIGYASGNDIFPIIKGWFMKTENLVIMITDIVGFTRRRQNSPEKKILISWQDITAF